MQDPPIVNYSKLAFSILLKALKPQLKVLCSHLIKFLAFFDEIVLVRKSYQVFATDNICLSMSSLATLGMILKKVPMLTVI